MLRFLFKIALNYSIYRVSKLYAAKHDNRFFELFTTEEFKSYIQHKFGCSLSNEAIESILLSNTKLYPSPSSTGRWFESASQSRVESFYSEYVTPMTVKKSE